MFTLITSIFAKPLFKKFGKYFIGAVLLGLLIWFLHNTWDNYKQSIYDEGYSNGVEDTTKKFKKIVEENNKRNREIENDINKSVKDIDKKITKKRVTRKKNEEKLSKDIMKEISELEDEEACVIPVDIINNRNRIRELGPEDTQ